MQSRFTVIADISQAESNTCFNLTSITMAFKWNRNTKSNSKTNQFHFDEDCMFNYYLARALFDLLDKLPVMTTGEI